MLSFISLIHVLTCVFIVIFILLQDPKGGVLGNLGGGSGSKSLFGAQGAGSFLVTATKWLAIIFALTSISLSYISSKKNKASLMEAGVTVEEPAGNSAAKSFKNPTDKSPAKNNSVTPSGNSSDSTGIDKAATSDKPSDSTKKNKTNPLSKP